MIMRFQKLHGSCIKKYVDATTDFLKIENI